MVGLDHPVFGVDGGSLDQRQKVALHALPRHVGAAPAAFAPAAAGRGDLVDLVDEDDSVLLGVEKRGRLQLVFVDQLGCLFVDQHLERFGDLHPARLALGAADVGEQALELLGHVLHAGRTHDLERRLGIGNVDVDLLVVERSLAQALAHHLPRGVVGKRRACPRLGARIGRRAHQHVKHAVFGSVFGAGALPAHGGFAFLLDGAVDQVADDRVDVLANVADLGKFRRLDLDERRVG